MLHIQQVLLFLFPYGAEWLFLLAVVIGYYFDYRKNKAYYREALATWIIVFLGAVIIYAVASVFRVNSFVTLSLMMSWLGWVVHRTSNSGKRNN
jgi:hypothetical protein